MPNTESLPNSTVEDTTNCNGLLTDNYSAIDNSTYAVINALGGVCQPQEFDSLSIPAGATIDGIQVILDMQGNTGNGWPRIYIHNGTEYSSNKPVVGTVPKSPMTILTTPAAENDLWGLSWNATTAAGIKVKLETAAGPSESHIDHAKVKVFYTAAVEAITPTTKISSGTLNLKSGNLIIK